MAEATRGTALTRTGKTRRKVECTPPNKKCGGRCIPPDWDCRLEGKGTNPELKVVKNDPLAGAASIQRGAKDVAKGVTTLDPAKVERGRNSIIRGIVKITPGNNLEDKKKLRKKLEEGSSAAFALTLVGILGVVGHRSLNNSSFYRERIGRKIDQAAFRAVNAVLDVTPGQRGRRNAIRSAATVAQIQTMRAAQRGYALTTAGQRAAENLGRMGPLGFLGARIGASNSPLLNDARLRDTMKTLAAEAMSNEDFATKATKKLFSTTIEGKHNLFSAASAQTFLNSEFQLGLGSVINPPLQRRMGSGLVNNPAAGLTLADRKEAVIEGLTSRIEQWGGAMRADMVIRGYTEDGQKITPAQITRYIREQALPIVRPYAASMGPNADVALINYERQLRLFIGAGGSSTSARRVARQTYLSTVKGYDTYFTDVVDRFSGGPMARSSPFADGKVALAKYLRGSETYNPARGTGYTRIVSREHANLLVNDWYHRRQEGDTPYTVTPATAQRIAQVMQRSPELPSPDDALATLRRSGLRVQYAPTAAAPRRYGERTEAQMLASMMRQTRVNRRGERVPRYTSRAAALRALRAQQQEENRGDSEPGERVGKPCGESSIPKKKECHKKVVVRSGEVKTMQHTNTETGKRTARYRFRQIASLSLRAGATVGGGLIVGNEIKKLVSGKEISPVLSYAALLGVFGATSIAREMRVTRSTKDLIKDFEGLKREPGVEARTVDQLIKFVADAGIDVQRVSSSATAVGIGGSFDTAKPNRIHSNGLDAPISSNQKIKGTPTASYAQGIEKMIQTRQAYALGGVIAPKTMSDIMTFHSHGSFIGNRKGQSLFTNAHEIAHAIHYRGDFATPSRVTVNGKVYEGAALERELKRSSSIYGQSDLTRTAKGKTKNYYETGSRLETYAENYAMYVGNGQAMKRAYPVSYEWTKLTTDYALSRPVNKPAQKFTSVVEGLSELVDRKYIDRLDSEQAFLSYYKAIREASVKGDVKTTIQILLKAESEKVSAQELQMLSAYLETAVFYYKLDAPKELRKDAGKPCGETHIPKEKKCHKKTTAPSIKEQIAKVVVTGAYTAYVASSINDARRQNSAYKAATKIKYAVSRATTNSNNKSDVYTMRPTALASNISKLKGQPGVNDKVIDQINEFIRKSNITVNMKPNAENLTGALGFWSPSSASIINVPYFDKPGTIPNVNSAKVANAGRAYLSQPKPFGLFRRHSVSSHVSFGSSEQFSLTTIHELGHAIHGRSGFATPKKITINGKAYEGAALTRALSRSITSYGSTDLRYGRYETFAEYFSMYITAHDSFKRKNPVAWAWTKSIVDNSLKQASGQENRLSNKSLASIMTIVDKTNKQTPMFDSSETHVSAVDLYRSAVSLALAGKTKELESLIKLHKEKLTSDQYFALGSLYETSLIYAFTKGAQAPMDDVVIDDPTIKLI